MDAANAEKERREKKGRSCPFEEEDNDTGEIQRAFQAGRLDVLFGLVDDGQISLDNAARFAKLSLEDARDMLFGWREAQSMGEEVV